jgi:hypothetical protein
MSVVDNAYHLCVFDRYTGVIEYGYAYDIFGKGIKTNGRRLKHLVYDLNQLDDTKIIVIFTTGYPGVDERKECGLPEALMRCGASKSFKSNSFLREDGAYILIGIPGIGPYNGFEESVDDKQLKNISNIDVEFTISGNNNDNNNDVDVDVDGNSISSSGWNIKKIEKQIITNKGIVNKKNYLTAGFVDRNDIENELWKTNRKNVLPDYISLCRKEAIEISKWKYFNNSSIGYYIGWLLSLIGIGHIITIIGRITWKILLMKLYYFLQICFFGYWTDESYELMNINSHIKHFSILWEKPYRKKTYKAGFT